MANKKNQAKPKTKTPDLKLAPQLALSQSEIAAVTDIDKSLGRLKVGLASIVVQHELQKAALVQQITQVEESFRLKLHELSQVHLPNPTAPWSFDFSTMAFQETKQDS